MTRKTRTAEALLVAHKLNKTHWGKRIIRAEKYDGFCFKDIVDSLRWTTCACGKQSAQIPRDDMGMPKDAKLVDLGTKFATAVRNHKYLAAAKSLATIEKRAGRILL